MFRKLILVSSLALASQAFAAEAGKVIYVAGVAHVAERPVVEGAAVQEGDLLATGADGYIYVRTVDNGLFILRPNTKARIATYHVDSKNPANTQVKLELLNGVARSKSGDAVKLARQNFRFNTPVAAIGVRGTDFTVFTDQDTSRVAVFTGRVVVSGFVDGCRPEGGGPCVGVASRELSATQRGQLLQVKRGQEAPQLLSSSGNSPDLVSPPRPDEPVAKAGSGTDPALDAKKSDSIDKLAKEQPAPQPQPQQPGEPTLPPPVVGEVKPEPQLPVRQLQWGRWSAQPGYPATLALKGPTGAEVIVNGDYVMYRTAGKDYVPERGNVSFNLAGGEATIHNGFTQTNVSADVKNGLLAVDFDKNSFTTSFDMVGSGETFKMKAQGNVSATGRFGNYSMFLTGNNMLVDGALSNANGGSAAYVFSTKLDANRTASGATEWKH